MDKRNYSLYKAMMIMIFTLLIGFLPNFKAEQILAATKTLTSEEIINKCNSQVGKGYPDRKCLAWVADLFSSLGATRSSVCCAYAYGSSHIQSTNINTIPLGADVFFGQVAKGPCGTCGSKYYGHIGIYVGNGYFIHATGGKVQKTSLVKTNWKNKFRGWGYHGNIRVVGEANGSITTTEPTPSKNYSISNVKVAYIDSERITITWSTSNLPRACMTVITGSQSWKTSYAIGNASSSSNSFSATFYRKNVSNCPSTVQILIYGYSNTSGAGQNETVHRVTYNASAGYVSFPVKQNISWSERIPHEMISQGTFTGWIVSDTSEIRNVTVTVNNMTLTAKLVTRADVSKAYPNYKYHKGYNLTISPYYINNGTNSYSVKATLADGTTIAVKSGTFIGQKIDCLFDPAFFKARYAGVAAVERLTSDKQLEKYFYDNMNMKVDGEYLVPSMLYSPSYYVNNSTDLKSQKWTTAEQSYDHFVRYCIKRGEYRAISPWVSLYYLHNTYSDLKHMSPEALLNWASTWGLKLDQRLMSNTNQAKAFQRFYQVSSYAALNIDLVRAFSKPNLVSDFNRSNADKYWRHLWENGISEGRNTSNLFNVSKYRQNAGLSSIASAWTVFNHYCNTGYPRGIRTK